MRSIVRLILVLLAGYGGALRADNDPLSKWRSGVKIRAVSEKTDRHSIHSYYLANPESPDGSKVVFFVSATADAHSGDLIILDRKTGSESVLASGIDTEDAHRAACQQWISGGRRIAYHDVKDARWSVHAVDIESKADR